MLRSKSRVIKNVLNFYGIEESQHPLASAIAGKCDQSPQLVSQLFRLIDAPDHGDCLLHMKPVCVYLIEAYCKHISKAFDEDLSDAINNVWAAVRLLANDNKWISSPSIHGDMNSNPAYAFHFSVCPFFGGVSSNRENFAPSYHSLAAYLHRRFFFWKKQIQAENPGINLESYRYRLGLAARKAIVGSEFDSGQPVFDIPLLIRIAIVKKTLQSQNIKGEFLINDGDPTCLKDLFLRDTRTYEKREKGTRNFLGRTERWIDFDAPPVMILPSGYLDSNLPKSSRPFDSVLDDSTDDASNFKYFSSPHVNNKATALGELEVDYVDEVSFGIPPSWLKSPWEAKRQAQGMIEAIVQSLNIQPWDDHCVSFHALRRLLISLEKEDLKLRRGARTIILFSILAGMSKSKLKKIGSMPIPEGLSDELLNSEDIIDGDCWIDVEKNILWRLAKHPSLADQPRSYHIGLIEKYDLPLLIAPFMSGFPTEQKRIFSTTDFKHAEQFLGELGHDGLTKITLSRLSMSFYAYFVNGAGFPALYADYLSGTESFHLLSQHSYVTIKAKHLNEEWLRMCGAFISGLKNSRAVESTLSEMKFNSLLTIKDMSSDDSVFIGASRTPKVSSLQQHLNYLWDCFPHTFEEIIRADADAWNHYMAYSYVFYAVCTAQRPLRDPCPRQGQINIELGQTYVADKNNRINLEFRHIPLCESLRKSLLMHDSIHTEWLSRKRMQGYELVGEPDAFLVEDVQNNQLVQVSPNRLDQLLGDGVGDEYFSSLNNGCRHFLLTVLHWHGVPQEWIDFISGHRHAGTEPTHISSPSSSTIIGIQLGKIIEEKVVACLGLKQPITK